MEHAHCTKERFCNSQAQSVTHTRVPFRSWPGGREPLKPINCQASVMVSRLSRSPFPFMST